MSTRVSEQTDEDLMARAQAGDVDAFAQLYDRHAVRAFRVARAICRDAGQAEDAVQEGFLSIWRSRRSYRPAMGRFQAWAMKIIQSRAIDSCRSAASRPPQQRGEETEAKDPRVAPDSTEAGAIARGTSDELISVMKRLPEAQVEVIVLAFFGDLSHSEIAAQLDLAKGTVKGRMRLGLEKLRSQMDVPA